MQNKIGEAEVKDILRHKEKKIESIHRKMLSLYQELENHEEMILSAVALPSAEINGMPGKKGGHKDLGDMLLQYKRQAYRRREELLKIMWELVEEEERINRIWACFHALQEPYYSILYELYVQSQLYEAVESNFQMSHKTFEKQRQFGIRSIIKFYESGMDVSELMRQHRSEKAIGKEKRLKTKQERAEEEYVQISLGELLNGTDSSLE